jgi:pyruvate formate lyase activating enzyme
MSVATDTAQPQQKGCGQMHGTREHSPIYGYLRNASMVDFEGHIAAVFFTTGCNFSCGFCHNAKLMGRTRKGLSWKRLGEACKKFQKDWVRAAVITGGEPTLSPHLPELIQFFKDELGWVVKLDTNGSNPDMLERCLPLVDYVAMDIKTAPSAYEELAGYSDTDALYRSVSLIADLAKDYEFRTTVIEEHHHDGVIDEIAHLIRGAKRYIVQPFIPNEELPHPKFRNLKRTSFDRLKEIAHRLQGTAHDIRVRGEDISQ